MTKSTKPKDTPEAEYQRFLETARKVEAEETEESFDRAFKKVTGHPPKNENQRRDQNR